MSETTAISPQHADDLANFFSGLAHPVRIQLISLLLEQEHNVSELVHMLNLPQARVSRHLQLLRQCGCCSTRQEGNWIYYRARYPETISAVLQQSASILGITG